MTHSGTPGLTIRGALGRRGQPGQQLWKRARKTAEDAWHAGNMLQTRVCNCVRTHTRYSFDRMAS
eukprot:435152-Pyramimonas_sp.AAC.1